MSPGAVIDQYFGLRRDRAGQQIPGAVAKLGAVQPVQVGNTAGGDDDDFGALGQNVSRFRPAIQADLDPQPVQFCLPPVGDA